jgi:hypothetical protein
MGIAERVARGVRSVSKSTIGTAAATLLAFLGVIGAAVLAVGALGYSSGATSVAKAVGAAIMDPLAVLEGRSPGEREAGALFQTKPRPVAPVARVRPRRPGMPAEPVAAVPPPTPFIDLPGAPVPLGGEVELPIAPVVFGGVPGGPGGPPIPVFGGGGGFPPPPPVVPPVVTPPVAAVPEPSTWAMLILGFGLVGAVLRRQGARAVRDA